MQAPICSVVSQDPPAKTKVHTQKIANEIIVLQALRHTIGNTAFLLKSQGKLPKQPVKTYLFRWLEGSAAWAHWPGNCLAIALIGDTQHGIYEGVLESSWRAGSTGVELHAGCGAAQRSDLAPILNGMSRGL